MFLLVVHDNVKHHIDRVRDIHVEGFHSLLQGQVHPDHVLAHGVVLCQVEQLPVLAELLLGLLEVSLVSSFLLSELHDFLQQVLLDHLKESFLLQRLFLDVERQVFSVHNTLYEVKVLWDQVLASSHEEDPPQVQLNIVLPLLRLL